MPGYDDKEGKIPSSVGPSSIQNWKNRLDAALDGTQSSLNLRPGETTVSINKIADFVANVREVSVLMEESLAEQSRNNDLSLARRLAAEAEKAELEAQLTSAKVRREEIGRRTDVVGQYESDIFARALTAAALAVFGLGTAILGVSEYYRVSGPLAILVLIVIPVLWSLGLVLFIFSLAREKKNADKRATLLEDATREAARTYDDSEVVPRS